MNTLLGMTLFIHTLMKPALVLFLWSSLDVMNRMDRQVFDYSMKNVPIPSERLVQLEFLNSIHKLSKKMRWRAKRHLQPELFQNKKETYSINTSKNLHILKS